MSAPPARGIPTASRLGRGLDWPKHAVIVALLLVELFPIYVMVQVSLKDNATFIHQPWLPTSPSLWHWENWDFACRLILPYIANTALVALAGTAGTLVMAVFGAYFFARQKVPGQTVLWGAFLMLMLMPSVVNITPLFMLLKSLHLLNSIWALVLVGIASGQVFSIFVLRHFIEDLPRDLFEAAEIDGASHLRQVWNIVVPMSSPIIGTLAILSFLGLWNDFLLPLIILSDKKLFTLGVGLIYLDGEYVKQWGQIMAAYFVSSIPLVVIFLFTMRLFVRGLSAGAIKG